MVIPYFDISFLTMAKSCKLTDKKTLKSVKEENQHKIFDSEIYLNSSFSVYLKLLFFFSRFRLQ